MEADACDSEMHGNDLKIDSNPEVQGCITSIDEQHGAKIQNVWRSQHPPLQYNQYLKLICKQIPKLL